jgi:hypothetical protein
MSSNGGAGWTSLNTRLSHHIVQSLALDPSGATLYAGTTGGGVVALTLASAAG